MKSNSAYYRMLREKIANDEYARITIGDPTVHGRPLSSYYGPADPEVIERLVDAICPPFSRRSRRKDVA